MVIRKPVFDGHGRDVFAFGRLEQLFNPAGNLKTPLFVDFTHVAGFEKAVLGEFFHGLFRHLIVACHVAGTLDQDLPIITDTLLHVRIGRPHVAGTHLAGLGAVGVGHILCHTVPFEQLKPQVPVPLDDLFGNRCRTGAGKPDMIKAQLGENLLFHHTAENWNFEQPVKLFRRHLLENAKLEF